MGNSRFDPTDWSNYSTTHHTGKSTSQIFTATKMAAPLNPANIKLRESRDSVANPLSTPLMIASDVTGSLGIIAHQLITTGIPKVVTEIYDRKPMTDPHVMALAIGDARGSYGIGSVGDDSPLQATEFEAESKALLTQIEKLHVEGGGWGNGGESYSLAHYFAANRVVSDSWEKRRKKGYLFTIGDEPCHDGATKDELIRVFGGTVERNYTARELADAALKTFHVFHIVLVNEGHCRGNRSSVIDNWQQILPERIIQLEDLSLLAETIVSTVQVVEGQSKASVANSWGSGTDLVIANALRDVVAHKNQGGAQRLA